MEYCSTGYLDITRDKKEGPQKDGKMKLKGDGAHVEKNSSRSKILEK